MANKLHAGVKRQRNGPPDNDCPKKVSVTLSPSVTGAVKKLQRACQELQLSSLPREMTGREDERDEIYTALRSSIEQQSAGGPIYISGLPGAGKTSIVKEVIRLLETERDDRKLRNFAWVEVNGLQMPRPDIAYSVLWKALQPPENDEGGHDPMRSRTGIGAARLCEMLQREFHTKSSTRPMLLVLLDEMDFMLAGKNQVLYNLLEWQTSATAKLVLVGIANTMDLPERLPTKIRSRLGGHRITFPAYTRAQLENIIQQRLLQLDIFSEEAIQICAKTLAHQSGDVRQALSLCRKSAEVCLNRLTSLGQNSTATSELFVTGEDLHEAQQAVSVSAPMSRLRACSKFECTFLVALRMEVRSNAARGVNKSGAELEAVIERFAILCKTHSFVPIPRLRGLLFICDELERSGIIKQISTRTSRYPLLELRCSHQELQDVFLTHHIGMQLIS
ncbi:Origin recognition complex subunit 1 [Phytophthora citrophthora]|uniref:Origin recognition complex subunit 1 n=1 Tax=Phytophthora citrophthora TaxID=4793 RepID=A0AAD9H029_9STRA|nr:Origin recognition complex subunit 1 [Phytophthora citrophthora]